MATQMVPTAQFMLPEALQFIQRPVMLTCMPKKYVAFLRIILMNL